MSDVVTLLRRGVRKVGRQALQVPPSLAAWGRFWNSYALYRQLAPPDQRPSLRDLYPCLGDDTSSTPIEPIYFYQDAWAFEHIATRRPPWHVDVGSHHKFISLLSKVVRLTMVDLRPLSLPLATIEFRQGSILQLPFTDGSVPSVSSLCVVEHIGLGRYGDPLDPRGSERAVQELKRIVQPGGDLYLSVPLDNETRVYFNAHRAFCEEEFLGWCAPFTVLERRYIHGDTFSDRRQSGFGTGCYHLRRPGVP